MKKLFLLFVVLCITSLQTYAQEQPVKTKGPVEYVYCELQGSSKAFSAKVTVNIDMGQRVKAFSGKNRSLVDENNEPIVFNSMIDAMNYMGKNGWEFVQAYVVTMGNSNVYHWLLKKDISTFSEEEKKDLFNNIQLNK